MEIKFVSNVYGPFLLANSFWLNEFDNFYSVLERK